MNDPERLLLGSPDALAARLLRAGVAEAPAARSVERTLAAVGVATGALGTAGTAGALGAASVGKAATTLSLVGIAKWAGLGIAGGVAVSLAAHGLGTLGAGRAVEPDAATRGAITATTLPPAKPQRAGPGERSQPAVAVSAEATHGVDSAGSTPAPHNPRAASSAFAPSDTSAPLAAEVGFVDGGRALFQRGDARGALAALASYERTFPDRRLWPEVLFLRMEALAQSGDTAQAAAVARLIVRDFGKGPHAAKARALLARP